MANELLEAALEYASKGMYVFPCREKDGQKYYDHKHDQWVIPPAKSPYGGSGGLHNASIDSIQIKEWWNKYPNAAVGVNCGKSNLFVIDIVSGGGNYSTIVRGVIPYIFILFGGIALLTAFPQLALWLPGTMLKW